jgi:hypothetical protein
MGCCVVNRWCLPLLSMAWLAAAACVSEAPTPSLAVARAPLIGGATTGVDEDPAVIALTSGGAPICTGTLVSPSVVLTAAHCIDKGGDNTVHFGHNVYEQGRKVAVRSTRTHPAWNGTLESNDIGMVLLQFPQDPELAIPLNTAPVEDFVGQPYRIVGFGAFQASPPMYDGKKRQATTTISELAEQGDVLLTGDDSVRVCFGDSGGPGFLNIDGVEYVAGVHSFTISQQCKPPMGDTRVDLHVEDFLLPFINEQDPACGKNGSCARIGCTDDPDCLPCGPEGTCVEDCPLPDWDCPTQQVGELCHADSQCMSGTCVFWQEQPQTKFCSQSCTPDESGCPGGMSCQRRPDLGYVCYYDNDPPGLVGSACSSDADCGTERCEDKTCTLACDAARSILCPKGFTCEKRTGGEYLCYREIAEGGGCAIKRAGPGSRTASGGSLLVLVLGAWMVRRRRR